MPKKRRRQTTVAPAMQTTSGWQWRSFPVFFAFVAGAFLMGVVSDPTSNYVGFIFFYAALFGVAFGAAHYVTRRWAERRARSRQAAAMRPPEARQPAKAVPPVEPLPAATAPSPQGAQEVEEHPRQTGVAPAGASQRARRHRPPRRR